MNDIRLIRSRLPNLLEHPSPIVGNPGLDCELTRCYPQDVLLLVHRKPFKVIFRSRERTRLLTRGT
jgi:hypothetical protein